MVKQLRNVAAASTIFGIVQFTLWILFELELIPQVIYGVLLILILFIQIGTFTLILIYLKKIKTSENSY